MRCFQAKGRISRNAKRPAQERQRHRRDMPGGEAADDGVAGPAQRGDAEQEIRLVGEPVAGGGGARGLVGSRHQSVVLARVQATPRPGPARTAGPDVLPGPSHRHGFPLAINGARCIASMHRADRNGLVAVCLRAVHTAQSVRCVNGAGRDRVASREPVPTCRNRSRRCRRHWRLTICSARWISPLGATNTEWQIATAPLVRSRPARVSSARTD